MAPPTAGTHGYGYGVTGPELLARIAARRLCPGCAGTTLRWRLDLRAAVPCDRCSPHAAHASQAPAAVGTEEPEAEGHGATSQGHDAA